MAISASFTNQRYSRFRFRTRWPGRRCEVLYRQANTGSPLIGGISIASTPLPSRSWQARRLLAIIASLKVRRHQSLLHPFKLLVQEVDSA